MTDVTINISNLKIKIWPKTPNRAWGRHILWILSVREGCISNKNNIHGIVHERMLETFYKCQSYLATFLPLHLETWLNHPHMTSLLQDKSRKNNKGRILGHLETFLISGDVSILGDFFPLASGDILEPPTLDVSRWKWINVSGDFWQIFCPCIWRPFY